MKILGVIPARYESSRFPGKPLILIDGMSMIERVYRQSLKSTQLSSVVVATDDIRIYEHVLGFGGKAVMTSSTHQSGTDRCAEVAANLDYDILVNIQGDEPYIDPDQIDLVCACFNQTETQIATLIKKITEPEQLFNPNIPKVVINQHSEAIYFSRQAIPYLRGVNETDWLQKYDFWKHIGIYAYTSKTLKILTKLPQSTLELAESLEQLRWIQNGFTIKVKETFHETLAIDTPEDLEKLTTVNKKPA